MHLTVTLWGADGATNVDLGCTLLSVSQTQLLNSKSLELIKMWMESWKMMIKMCYTSMRDRWTMIMMSYNVKVKIIS